MMETTDAILFSVIVLWPLWGIAFNFIVDRPNSIFGDYSFYNKDDVIDAIIVLILGLFNFIVYPFWYYHKLKQYRMDKVMRELQS